MLISNQYIRSSGIHRSRSCGMGSRPGWRRSGRQGGDREYDGAQMRRSGRQSERGRARRRRFFPV